MNPTRPVESKTGKHNGLVGLAQRMVWTVGLGDAGQNKVPADRSPWILIALLAFERNEKNCSERRPKHTNKRNPM